MRILWWMSTITMKDGKYWGSSLGRMSPILFKWEDHGIMCLICSFFRVVVAVNLLFCSHSLRQSFSLPLQILRKQRLVGYPLSRSTNGTFPPLLLLLLLLLLLATKEKGGCVNNALFVMSTSIPMFTPRDRPNCTPTSVA